MPPRHGGVVSEGGGGEGSEGGKGEEGKGKCSKERTQRRK